MSDFWSTLRKADITIVRNNVGSADSTGVTLRTGKHVDADYVIYATGWGDHFSFLSPDLKQELGLPPSGAFPHSKLASEAHDPWYIPDQKADQKLAEKIPLLAAGPKDFNGWKRPVGRESVMKVQRWRLYNRVVPLADDSNHSIVVLGQIHTTQTPCVAEIQSLWAVAYLLGELELPSGPDMVREIAEWNAWTRKRYGAVGERYPYALFDWVPYLDRLLCDLEVNTKRNGGFLADFFVPYGPRSYSSVVAEYMESRVCKKQ